MKLIYLLLSFVNDFRAIRRGKIAERLGNHLIGKHLVRRLWIR